MTRGEGRGGRGRERRGKGGGGERRGKGGREEERGKERRRERWRGELCDRQAVCVLVEM